MNLLVCTFCSLLYGLTTCVLFTTSANSSVDKQPFEELYNAILKGGEDAVLDIVKSISEIEDTCLDRTNTPLHATVSGGYIFAVGVLLTRGADPSDVLHGKTPLDIALEQKQHTIAEMLESAGGVLSCEFSYSKHIVKSMAYFAAYGGKPKIYDLREAILTKNIMQVENLLNAHVPIYNDDNDLNASPLYLSVERKLWDVAELLIYNGADATKREKNIEESPNDLAFRNGDNKVLDLILGKFDDTKLAVTHPQVTHSTDDHDKNKNYASVKPTIKYMYSGIAEGSDDDLNKYAKAKIYNVVYSYKCMYPYPLQEAIKTGNTHKVNILLNAGAEFYKWDVVAMHTAILTGNIHTVEILLDHGSNPHRKYNRKSAKEQAETMKRDDIVSLIQNHAAYTESSPATLLNLKISIFDGSLEEVQRLIARCAPLAVDKSLLYVVYKRKSVKNRSEKITALIKAGAIFNTRLTNLFCKNGDNNFIKAAMEGQGKYFSGALANFALQMCVVYKNINIIIPLLNYGANPHAKHIRSSAPDDDQGLSAYEWAVSSKETDYVKMATIIESHVSFKNNFGLTFAHLIYTLEKGTIEVLKRLLEAHVPLSGMLFSKYITVFDIDLKKNDVTKCKMIMDAILNQNKDIYGLMQQAILYLVDNGIELGQYNLILAAMENNDAHVLAFLMNSGIDLNRYMTIYFPGVPIKEEVSETINTHPSSSKDLSAVLYAVKIPHRRLLRALIDIKAPLNRPDEDVKPFVSSPLHEAVRNGDIESVKILLQGGAQTDPFDSHFNTPMECLPIHLREDSMWKGIKTEANKKHLQTIMDMIHSDVYHSLSLDELRRHLRDSDMNEIHDIDIINVHRKIKKFIYDYKKAKVLTESYSTSLDIQREILYLYLKQYVDVKDDLDCAICKQPFGDKLRVLSCSRFHTLCDKCYQRLLKQYDGRLKCPHCRQISENSTSRFLLLMEYKICLIEAEVKNNWLRDS